MTILSARLQRAVAAARRADVLEGDGPAQPARLLLAALAGGAGVIHLGMVPSHMAEWAVEGGAFAAAGLLQLVCAALLVTRPSRWLMAGGIALSLGLVAAWALSRTTGMPFGPHAWHAESATFIDGACVTMELALAASLALALARPRWGAGWSEADRFGAYAMSLAVLVLATAALASPSARDHAAHAHGAHGENDRGLSLLTNGHHHAIVQRQLDAQTQAALDEQLRVTRAVAREYPTVADAEAAGYRRAGPYSPGLGAHYIKYGSRELNADGVIDGDDARYPLAIIYDGTDPESAVAGFMFYTISEAEPRGFAGDNDVWHYHENICLKFAAGGQVEAPFGPDNAATDAQCAAVGGQILHATQWMVHVWSVPGWNNIEGGVFAEVNPELDCPDGTYYQLPPEWWASSPLTTCRG